MKGHGTEEEFCDGGFCGRGACMKGQQATCE